MERKKAPDGHRRLIEIFLGSKKKIKINCECGWKSFVLLEKYAEEQYDLHLDKKSNTR